MNNNLLYRYRLWILFFLTFILRALCVEHGISSHPDERHIIMVTERLSLADPNPHSFAYGGLLFYLLKGVSTVLSVWSPKLTGYENLFIVGRTINGVIAGLTVLVLYFLTRLVFKRESIALLSAFILATNTLFFQLSHFYISDIPLTLFSLLALYYSVCITIRGQLRYYILFGISTGLALAFKISALSLLVPLLVSHLIVLYQDYTYQYLSLRRFLYLTAYIVIALAIIPLTFFIFAPYSFLDWSHFSKDIHEQLSMVSGEWIPPYTRQYQFTAPYLYHIYQMGTSYALGWPVLITGLCGFTLQLVRASRRSTNLFRLLPPLIWSILVFATIGGKFVKFPRYLITIYPIIIMLSASVVIYLTLFLKQHKLRYHCLAYIPIAFIICCVTFPTLGLIGIYSNEHTYRLASAWIFDNIPSNTTSGTTTTIVGTHWDDKVPVDLPNRSTRQYNMWHVEQELPLYEPDTEEKINIIYGKIHRADYLIFPTDRLPGSILQAEKVFPYTANFIRLLYQEKLGFKLIKTVKLNPSFLGIKLADNSLDESFTVYDHPRVSIFKKQSVLAPGEFRNLLMQPPLKEPTRATILNLEAQNILVDHDLSKPIFKVLTWLIVFEGFGLIALPLLLFLSAQKQLALGRSIGFLIFGLTCWVINTFGLSIDETNAQILYIVLLVASITALCFSNLSTKLPNIKILVRHSLPWTLFFFIFLLARIFSPEINWGEKPMDFTFLNYFSRLHTLPPDDPWAVHHKMSYYYFGLYLFALMHKLTGIDTGSIFNLSIATIAGLIAANTYSIFTLLTNSTRFSLLAVTVMVCSANAEMVIILINELFSPSNSNNFDLFWASTRIFPPYSFSEYPLWSLLFADLHAHVIALPFTILFISLLINFGSNEKQPHLNIAVYRILTGTVLGALYLLNTWDFLVYAMLFAIMTVILLIAKLRKSNDLYQLSAIVKLLLFELIIPSAFCGMIIAVYMFNSTPNPPLSWGWVVQSESLPFLSFWRMFGWQLTILFSTLFFLCPFSFLRDNKARLIVALLGAIAVLGAVPLIRPLIYGICHYANLPNGAHLPDNAAYPILIHLLAAMLMFYAIMIEKINGILAGLIILFLSILIGVETIFLIDRMNTIFKFFNAAWIVVTIASVYAVYLAIVKGQSLKRKTFGQLSVYLMSTLIILISLTGGLSEYIAMITFHRIQGHRPSLDGTSFLNQVKPQEQALIEFLNHYTAHANHRTAPVLEAHGNSYGEFTRIAMYTGLPTLIGWEHHVKQRGLKPEEVQERIATVRTIYSTTNPLEAARLLKKYQIKLVVIGPLEYITYPLEGLEKFKNNPQIFNTLFNHGKYSVVEAK